MHRFFVPEPIQEDQHRVVLEGQEAHHLGRVLRAVVGDEVVLLDGTGWEYTARVASISRRSVELELLARRRVDRELPVPVLLGTALPKAPRQQAMVESLVQLGLTALVPLQTARSVVRVDAKGLARLSRWVQEATKQCGRTRLMEVRPGCDFSHWIARQTEPDRQRVIKLLAQPDQGVPLCELLRAAIPRAAGAFWLSVGPEGGFTPAEVELARQHGWQLVQLGRRTLRIETAACLLVGAVSLWLEGGEPRGGEPHRE